MSNTLWERLGALSGILFVVLLFAGVIIASAGFDVEASDSAKTIAAEFADNRDQLKVGASIELIGIFFLLWFLGYLRSHLQQAEGEGGWITSAAYGGGF